MSLTDDNYKLVYITAAFANFGNQHGRLVKLGAKLDDGIYSVWIKPSASASGKWKLGHMELKWTRNELFLNNRQLPTVPLRTALLMFHGFLTSSPGQFILVFQSSFETKLLKLFQKTGLVDLFHGLIAGFVYTPPIWKKDFGNRLRHAASGLSVLSREYLQGRNPPNIFGTTTYLRITEELALKISSKSELIKCSESYIDIFTRAMQQPDNAEIYRGLEPLLSVISEVDLRKMASAQLSYDVLAKQFQRTGAEGLDQFLNRQGNIHELLRADDNKIQQNIVNFFKSRNPRHNTVEASTGKQDAIIHEPSSSGIHPTSAPTKPGSSKTKEVSANLTYPDLDEELQLNLEPFRKSDIYYGTGSSKTKEVSANLTYPDLDEELQLSLEPFRKSDIYYDPD